MSDFYTEQLIKRKTPTIAYAVKGGMIFLTVVSAVALFFFSFGIVLPVIMAIADFFVFRRLDIEYEYLYVDGDLYVDMIMSKQKRKRKFSTNMGNLEMIAPQNADAVKDFQAAKSYDFSSGTDSGKKYEMIVSEGGQKIRIIFEPNEKILQGMRMAAPRKVMI